MFTCMKNQVRSEDSNRSLNKVFDSSIERERGRLHLNMVDQFSQVCLG